MRSSFDRRVLSDDVLDLVRACQAGVPCHLGGGAALSGAHLSHRLSRDIDLFCHRKDEVRELLSALPDLAQAHQMRFELVRDAGGFVRGRLHRSNGQELEVDLVHDALTDLEPAPALEGVVLESLADLRAAKLTCLLSRSEPRDLVDLLFLDRAGFPPENDLPLALAKDAGIDPGVLAWLLGQYPTGPLPLMLTPLGEEDLRAFRDQLRERFRRLTVRE